MTFIWVVVAVFLVLLAYVRFTPSDPEMWHKVPEISGDKTWRNGASRIVMTGKDGLRRLEAIVIAEPRSDVLAGSVEEGMITFVTRSRMIGFPDYTTAMQDGEELSILARSRFGRGDLGVNAARVDRWIAALTTR